MTQRSSWTVAPLPPAGAGQGASCLTQNRPIESRASICHLAQARERQSNTVLQESATQGKLGPVSYPIKQLRTSARADEDPV